MATKGLSACTLNHEKERFPEPNLSKDPFLQKFNLVLGKKNPISSQKEHWQDFSYDEEQHVQTHRIIYHVHLGGLH